MILESDLEAYQMVRCVSIRLTSGWLVLGALWIFRHLTEIAKSFGVCMCTVCSQLAIDH